jgi:DNA polymerase-3 subunit gamma/tau
LELGGNVEQILFDQLKTSLITFLRERTGNSSLLIQTQVVENMPENTKPRTTKEKFNHLAEKNPVLKDLKERFGLDPDLA